MVLMILASLTQLALWSVAHCEKLAFISCNELMILFLQTTDHHDYAVILFVGQIVCLPKLIIIWWSSFSYGNC